ncbi:MAG: nuclease domain-containing protein [Bacteroidia bacterium]
MHYSSILTRAPGYRDFYHQFLLLQKGLSISQDDIFQLDYKRISTLYEYWCFLKMVKILRDEGKYDCEASDLIKVEQNRLVVNLRKGKESRIRMVHRETGEVIYLWFNRTFKTGETHTFSQVPDHVIEFEKEGYQQPFRFILDAKYRFDRGSKSYPESRVKYGPPLDAIAQLHRYRDAILSQKKAHLTQTTALKSLGGLVLFPFPDHEETFRAHKFYQSRFEVNIGAVPLQPGKDKKNRLFKEFLQQLFSSSPEALYEKTIEYEKTDHHKVIEAAGKKVMIGLIPNDKYRDQRLSFHLGVMCYHTFAKGNCLRYLMLLYMIRRKRPSLVMAKWRQGKTCAEKSQGKRGTVCWPSERPDGAYVLFPPSEYGEMLFTIQGYAGSGTKIYQFA